MSSSWPSCEYMLDKQHRPVPGRQIGSPCSRIRPPAGGRPLRCLQGQSKHAKRGSVVSRGGTGGGRPGPTRRRIRRDDADVGRTRNGRFSGGAREVKGFGISSSPRQVVSQGVLSSCMTSHEIMSRLDTCQFRFSTRCFPRCFPPPDVSISPTLDTPRGTRPSVERHRSPHVPWTDLKGDRRSSQAAGRTATGPWLREELS